MKANINEILGKEATVPGKCDRCSLEGTDCRKVYVKGIGDVCFINVNKINKKLKK